MKKPFHNGRVFFVAKNPEKPISSSNNLTVRDKQASYLLWPADWIMGVKQDNYAYDSTLSSPAASMLGRLQIHRLVRKNLTAMMITLFIIAIAVFIYMIYVLIKPEKF